MENSHEIKQFGEFLLDFPERRLLRTGELVALTPKAFETLHLFVGNPGRLITRDELLSRIWAGVNVEDATLSRTISDLRKALGDGDNGRKFIETVPKFGYRFVAPVETSVTVDTSAGVDTSVPVALPVPDAPTTRKTGGRRVAVAVGVSVGVMVVALLWYALHSAAPTRITRLAILPLRTFGPSADPILELGIADALISRLSRLQEFEVRSIGAVRRYTGKDPDAAAVGRELQVDGILEGTIQHIAGKLRVNLRLTELPGGRTRWSESFTQSGSDILALEDSLSTSAATALATHLTNADRGSLVRRSTPDQEAYRLYMEGRYLFGKRNVADFPAAADRFRQACLRDPSFAEAHAALAELLLLGDYGTRPLPQVIAEVMEHANRAVAVDPMLASGWRVLALVAENYEYDRRKSADLYLKSLRIDPRDATTREYYAELLSMTGNFGAAESEMETAYRLDPVSVAVQMDRAQLPIRSRHYDVAESRFRRIVEIEPQSPRAWEMLAIVNILRHDYQNARADFARYFAARGPAGKGFTPLESCAEGDKIGAMRQMKELDRPENRGQISTAGRAHVYAWCGMPDRALDILEEIYENRSGAYIIGLETDPLWDPLRGVARFQKLLARTGGIEPEEILRLHRTR